MELTVIGDQMYSVQELGGACARRGVHLVAPRRLAAALYEPVSPRAPGTNGRPRVQGKRLPQLKQVLKEGHTPWQRRRMRWYNSRRRELEVTSGTGWPAGAAHPLGARARSHRPPGATRLGRDLYP